MRKGGGAQLPVQVATAATGSAVVRGAGGAEYDFGARYRRLPVMESLRAAVGAVLPDPNDEGALDAREWGEGTRVWPPQPACPSTWAS